MCAYCSSFLTLTPLRLFPASKSQRYANTYTLKLYSDIFRWRPPPPLAKTTQQTTTHCYEVSIILRTQCCLSRPAPTNTERFVTPPSYVLAWSAVPSVLEVPLGGACTCPTDRVYWPLASRAYYSNISDGTATSWQIEKFGNLQVSLPRLWNVICRADWKMPISPLQRTHQIY